MSVKTDGFEPDRPAPAVPNSDEFRMATIPAQSVNQSAPAAPIDVAEAKRVLVRLAKYYEDRCGEEDLFAGVLRSLAAQLDRMASAERDAERWHGHFLKYGKCSSGCATNRNVGVYGCTCGFVEAMNEACKPDAPQWVARSSSRTTETDPHG